MMSFLRWSYWFAGGLHPKGFHIVNIVLHGIVSVLMLPVFDLLLSACYTQITLGDFAMPRGSLLCAVLFASHPVHTESVSFCDNHNHPYNMYLNCRWLWLDLPSVTIYYFSLIVISFKNKLYSWYSKSLFINLWNNCGLSF